MPVFELMTKRIFCGRLFPSPPPPPIKAPIVEWRNLMMISNQYLAHHLRGYIPVVYTLLSRVRVNEKIDLIHGFENEDGGRWKRNSFCVCINVKVKIDSNFNETYTTKWGEREHSPICPVKMGIEYQNIHEILNRFIECVCVYVHFVYICLKRQLLCELGNGYENEPIKTTT